MSQAGTFGGGGVVPVGVLETLSGNDGIVVGPDAAHNIKLLGNDTNSDGYGTNVKGNAGTNTETISSYGLAKWVVNPVSGLGTHQTITAALASASSGDDIFITTGTYAESFSPKAGVNIVAFATDDETPSVVIQGTITCTYTGSVTISGVEIQALGGFGIVNSGANATVLYLNDCNLVAVNNTFLSYTNSNSAAAINIMNSFGDILALGITHFIMTSSGSMVIQYCLYDNTAQSITPSTSSAGILNIGRTNFPVPLSFTGTASGTFNEDVFVPRDSSVTALTFGVGTSFAVKLCRIITNAPAAIVNTSNNLTLIYNDILSNNSPNAITGTGVIQYGHNTYPGTATQIATSMGVTPIFGSMGSLRMYGGMIKNYTPTAVSYQVLITDQIVGVTSNASARTITMPSAGLIKGQSFTIKDEAGTAASANNITISGNGANIDGAATYVINTNFGSVDIYWSGTNFFVK